MNEDKIYYGGEEYIRKEAMVQWLDKKMREFASAGCFKKVQAYQSTLDKINSL